MEPRKSLLEQSSRPLPLALPEAVAAMWSGSSSRLKPEMGPMKVVVFLRERKLGAGQSGQDKNILSPGRPIPLAGFEVIGLGTSMARTCRPQWLRSMSAAL
jgi:hypothetical protein